MNTIINIQATAQSLKDKNIQKIVQFILPYSVIVRHYFCSPPTKLRKVNVFSHVCLSRGRPQVTITRDAIDQSRVTKDPFPATVTMLLSSSYRVLTPAPLDVFKTFNLDLTTQGPQTCSNLCNFEITIQGQLNPPPHPQPRRYVQTCALCSLRL